MAKPLIGGRRSTIEIVYDILSVCQRGGANKTAIMYRSNLSYDQLLRYLALLSEQEFLRRNAAGRFEVTEKGTLALGQVAGAMRILRDMQEGEGSDGDGSPNGYRAAVNNS